MQTLGQYWKPLYPGRHFLAGHASTKALKAIACLGSALEATQKNLCISKVDAAAGAAAFWSGPIPTTNMSNRDPVN